jgi:nicotinic acid mononucleotide adenylyltransferase
MDKWYEPEVIFRLAHIGVYCRGTGDYISLKEYASMLRNRFSAKITLFKKDDQVDISSTEIRNALAGACDKNVTDYLPDKVLSIIKKYKLYMG